MAERGGDRDRAAARHSSQSYRGLPLGQERVPGRRLSEMSSQAPALQGQRAGWSTVGAYVALTKPRIIELLLVTTLPTMVVAKRGPAVGLADGGHPGRRGAGRRRGQRHQHGGRPGHRPADEAHQEPPAGHRGHDAAGRAGLRPHPRGGGLRRAVAGREPALGRPGRLGHPLLRLRLHAVAQAPLLAEHRDRRRRRGGARPGRLGGGDRTRCRGPPSCSSPSSSSGPRRTSGPWPCATRRTTPRPTCPCCPSWPP